VTKFLEAAIASLLLDDAAVASFLEENGDISVTKFLAQDDNVAIDQDDHTLMIEFNLEHDADDNDISVTKFLDSTMARYLQ